MDDYILKSLETQVRLSKQAQLDVAINIASNARKGQFDKGGKPYILRPLHLMNALLFDTQLATIAVLHDVAEDSSVTLEDMAEAGMSLRVMLALDYLTHKPGVSYEDYIERVASNYDAIRIKRKDLEHNSDITRLKGISEKDLARMEKYHKAFLRLTEAKKMFERL